MKFVTIRDLRSKSRQIQNDLIKLKEMILTSNGKPIAIMMAISEDSLEESLSAIRRSRVTSSVTELQIRSVKKRKHLINLREINDEIKKARSERPNG